jgi:hypothetical protein
MNEYSKISSVVNGWIAEAIANQAVRAGEPVDSEYSSILDSLMFDNPASAWAALQAISQDGRIDSVGDVFGMGPLSSFIFHHGTDFREAIRNFWKTDQRFREHYKMVVFCDLAEAIIAPDNIAGGRDQLSSSRT